MRYQRLQNQMLKKIIKTARHSRLTLVTTVIMAAFAIPTLIQAQQTAPAPEAPVALTDSITLTAIPPRLGDADETLIASPGEKIQTSVQVRNASDQTIEVKSAALDFVIGDDGKTPIPVENQEVPLRWSLASWIILSPSFQTLSPGQTGLVNVIIEVPPDALPGGHYAMIAHSPTSKKTKTSDQTVITNSASGVNQRVGSLLYLKVDGPIHEEAFVRNLTLPQFTEYGPVPFSFLVDNQSDIHIRPQVSVEIHNMFGQKVETIQLDSTNIFPYSSREFSGKWERVWGAGLYTAKVVMSYSDGQISMTSATFWLLPFTLVGAGLVIILVIIGSYIAIRRHLIHRSGQEQIRIKLLEEKIKELENPDSQKYE